MAVMGVAYVGGDTEGGAKSGPVVDVLGNPLSGSDIEVGVARCPFPGPAEVIEAGGEV